MKLKALFAILSTLSTVLAGSILAAPAHAETLVVHEATYAPYAAGAEGASNPVVAMNAAGDRAFAAFTPPGQEGCDPGQAGIFVRGGSVNTNNTSWSSSAAQAEFLPGLLCGGVLDLKIFMSDDGTLGMLSWLAYNPINGDFAMRVARISWPLDQATPSITDNLWADDQPSSGTWPKYDAAMSADGSRAVVQWRLHDGGTAVMKYAVIDLANASSTRTQQLPDTYTSAIPVPGVAISDDGAIVALGAVATPDATTESSHAYRTAKVFVCSHNCYSGRLRTYSATAPAGKGPLQTLNLAMSKTGSVVAASWGNDLYGSAFMAFAPSARGTDVVLTSKVKYVNTISTDGSRNLVVNAAGTKLATLCQSSMCQTGSPDVVTASISPSFAISSVKSTPVLPALLAPFTDIYDFKFLNKSGSTPERLAMMTAELPPFSTTQTLRLLVSNDASSPSYWSSVWQRESDPNGWFSTPSFGMAANGSRFITASHHQVFADVEYLYDARVVTGATDTTVGIKKLPAITGSLKVGATLTVSAPTFVGLPAGASLSFEWLRDGESVSTGRSYALTQEDAGTTLSVTVTATADTSYPIAVSSVTSAIVKGGVLTVPTVTISGTAAVGSELQAQTSGSSTPGVSVSYTWKRGSSTVGELSSYTPTNADAGKSLTLVARFYKNGFTDKKVTVTSAVVVRAD